MRLTKAAEISLSEATKPLLVLSRLVGMNPKSHWHKIYTVLILVCEFSILGCAWQYYIGLPVAKFYFNTFVGALQESGRSTSFLVILVSGLLDRKRFMVPLNDLANVDQGLKKLGGHIDNRGTYRLQIFSVFFVGPMLLLFLLVEFSLDVFPTTDDQMFKFTGMGWFYHLTVIIISTVTDCSYSSILCIVRRRFKEINSIMHRTRNWDFRISDPGFRMHTGNDVLRNLRTLRKQYHDLWGIANRVNRAFGPHLLVGTLTSLTQIISNLWRSHTTFKHFNENKPHDFVETIIWALFYVVRMFLLVRATELTVTEAKATRLVLQELGMEIDHDRATKNEIRDFLTQLQFEVLKFTACGFFDFDFTLICGILGAACTYLVILIQMANPDSCVTTGNSNDSLHIHGGNNS